MKVMVALAVTLAFGAAASAQVPPVDAFPTEAGELTITFLGHATLMLRLGPLVIHVDPVGRYADYDRMPKAGLVLITHEHSDHLDPAAIGKVRDRDTEIVANEASAARIPGARVMRNGEALTLRGVRIEAVPAYNTTAGRTQYHPRGRDNGYLLTLGGKRVYVAGDTEDIPEMRALENIDIAFLPMNLPFTMTPEQVSAAARALGPRVLYPYHYGESDVALLQKLLKDERGVDLRIRPMQ